LAFMKNKRGRNAQGKKKRWSAARKEQELHFNVTGKTLVLPSTDKKKKRKVSTESVKMKSAIPERQPKTKKGKTKMNKEKQIDAGGDIVVEHDFGDSSDSEAEGLQRAAEEKKLKEREAAAKGRRQVVVTGIPWTADPDAFSAFFQKYSREKIVDAVYPKDQTGRSKGVAFFTFASESAVANALALDQKSYEARQISVKIPTDKRDRGQKNKGEVDSDDESDPSGFDSEFDDGSDEDDDRSRPQGKGKSSGKGKGKSKGKGKGKGKSSGKGKGK